MFSLENFYYPNVPNVPENELISTKTDITIDIYAFGGYNFFGSQLRVLDEAGVITSKTYINPPAEVLPDGTTVEIADDEFDRYSLDFDQADVKVSLTQTGANNIVDLTSSTSEGEAVIIALSQYFDAINVSYDLLATAPAVGGEPIMVLKVTDQDFISKQLSLGVDLQSEENLNNIEGTNNNDFLKGTQSDDLICTHDGNDIVVTKSGNDKVYSGKGDDLVHANEGDNFVSTSEGNDTIGAGQGDDTISSGEGNDKVFAGGGNDNITAGDGNDLVHSNSGNDRVYSGNGDDTIRAGQGDDFINAGDGNDIIFGEVGADFINAGEGNDIIFDYAGGGADTFFFDFDNDPTAEYDIIKGFDADVDTIILHGYGGLNIDYTVNNTSAGTEIVYGPTGNTDTILIADQTLDANDIDIKVIQYLELA